MHKESFSIVSSSQCNLLYKYTEPNIISYHNGKQKPNITCISLSIIFVVRIKTFDLVYLALTERLICLQYLINMSVSQSALVRY